MIQNEELWLKFHFAIADMEKSSWDGILVHHVYTIYPMQGKWAGDMITE